MGAVVSSLPRRRAHVARHFTRTRGAEVAVLQASPLLGACLGGIGGGRDALVRLALLLVGSLALTAHVFVFNDFAGYASDARDRRRGATGPAGQGIGRDEVGRVAAGLLLVAAACFAALGVVAVVLGSGIAGLSLVYSSSRLGKTTPGAATANHLVGGALHFLLGWSVVRGVDDDGLMLSLFFGLVFAAGHLNQEVRDAAADRVNGVRTSAVVFGVRRTFTASFVLFSAAYAVLLVLAMDGLVSRLLLSSAGAWVLHAAWSVQAVRRGLGHETALWMQRRYRLLFAVVGVALIVSAAGPT